MHREVIDLVYYHGRSIEEVAAITRVPPSTVKTRMFYAGIGSQGFSGASECIGLSREQGSTCKRQARVARPASGAMQGYIH